MEKVEEIKKRYDDWFNENKKIKQKEKEINTLINKFLKKYTTAKIMEMKIDYYVEGKADENFFVIGLKIN